MVQLTRNDDPRGHDATCEGTNGGTGGDGNRRRRGRRVRRRRRWGRRLANAVWDADPGNPNRPGNIAAVRGDRMWDWTEQTRSEVVARHGVVATSQPLAAQAGLQMLKEGGNAVDAAVATAAMLGVVEPESAGIGGDMEAIYYSAKNHQLYGLNAAGWAPASPTPAFYHNGPERGAVLRRVQRHRPRRGGRLEPAPPSLRPHVAGAGAAAVDRGRPAGLRADRADPRRLGELRPFYVDMLQKDPESRKVFLRDGQVPALYSNFRNPDLARAYELLAKDGPDAFYAGRSGARSSGG